ncbi:MAG TPA: hypothetical protein VEI97_15720 [bacterium]|nr:hypothetical protein [bacterium]
MAKGAKGTPPSWVQPIAQAAATGNTAGIKTGTRGNVVNTQGVEPTYDVQTGKGTYPTYKGPSNSQAPQEASTKSNDDATPEERELIKNEADYRKKQYAAKDPYTAELLELGPYLENIDRLPLPLRAVVQARAQFLQGKILESQGMSLEEQGEYGKAVDKAHEGAVGAAGGYTMPDGSPNPAAGSIPGRGYLYQANMPAQIQHWQGQQSIIDQEKAKVAAPAPKAYQMDPAELQKAAKNPKTPKDMRSILYP